MNTRRVTLTARFSCTKPSDSDKSIRDLVDEAARLATGAQEYEDVQNVEAVQVGGSDVELTTSIAGWGNVTTSMAKIGGIVDAVLRTGTMDMALIAVKVKK